MSDPFQPFRRVFSGMTYTTFVAKGETVDIDHLNKWLTLLANFGVVAGIIFLAVEIRQNQTLLEQNHQTMLRAQELEVLSATQLEVEQFNDLRAQIYLSNEMSELWLKGRSGEFGNEVEEYRYNQLCSAWFIANGLSYERSVILNRPVVLKALPQQSRMGIEMNPGMKTCWDRVVPFLVSFGFDEYVSAVENISPTPQSN